VLPLSTREKGQNNRVFLTMEKHIGGEVQILPQPQSGGCTMYVVLNCTDKKFPEIFVEYKGNFKEIGSNFIYVESFPLTYVNNM